MKTILKLIVLILIAFIGISATTTTKTIYFIGDSTMADYDTSTYPNQRGWGQMFRDFLTGDVNFVNAAKNGRSSKSFYTEGLWASVLSKVQAGDYVFIQFAHNDEKSNGVESSSATASIDPTGVGTAPWGDYTNYLTKYVNETRAKGAIPILVTPIVRRYFDGTKITCKGAHDLSSSTATTADDSTLNYVRAMKAVARTMNVVLVDQTALTKSLAESYGATNSKSIIYVSTDDTHLQPTGATLYARLVVQDLIKQGILVDNLNATPDLLVNPTSLDFGNCYVSSYGSKTFSVSGMDLNPSSGNITITAPNGFTISSTETGSYSSSLVLPYTNGNIAATSIYVHFTPTEAKTYSDTITIAGDGISTKKIAVSGVALALGNGVKSSVLFPLISDASATVTGPLISMGESWSECYAKNYATMPTWPTGAVTTDNTQRITTLTGSWPAEIDIVSTRYIQFGLKTPTGTTFTLDSIGFYAGGAGGGSMSYRVMYSTNANFSNPITLGERNLNNTVSTMYALSYKPIIQVKDTDTLYLRIYPWYGVAATGKYLCLQRLYIGGQVSNNTAGIKEPLVSSTISFYPNPAKTQISFQNITENTTIQVYSPNGTLVSNYTLGKDSQTINIADLPKGFYLLNVKTSKGIYKQKLVKK